MAWADPSSQTTGDLITASIWNQNIVSNSIALKTPPSAIYNGNESANYTVTATSFTDVDATAGKFSHDITTKGGRILVTGMFYLSANNTSARILFNITIDGVAQAADDGISGYDWGASWGVNIRVPFTLCWWSTSAPAADTYTVNLQWKTTAGHTGTLYAGAGTANADVHPQYRVVELT